jgi:hypothetical protein
MRALYAHLARALGTREGEARLLERHGAPAIKQVLALLDELDQH